jgi:alpha-beta hydrolase superfamily lysophospholipase
LGGHSSGGGLAVKYGGNSLSQFDGAFLLAPYLGYQAPTVRPNSGGWVQVAQLRYAGLAMLNNIGIKFLNNYPVLFFNRPAEVTGELQLESYSYQLNESFSPQSYAADLSNYKSPMLLLVGELDEAFYPNEFKKVLEINAPHTEFHLLKKTKHLDLPFSEEAAKLINMWLVKTFNKSS